MNHPHDHTQEPSPWIGELGIGDGWYLVLHETHYDDVILDNHGLAFGNEHRIIMPTVYPAANLDATRAADIAARAATDMTGPTVTNLGPLHGHGWTGSLALEDLGHGEQQYLASMGAAHAYLTLAIRFRTPQGQAGADTILTNLRHEPNSAEDMNWAITHADL